MDKGRQNVFWVGTGVAAALAVAIFVFMVFPMWTTAGKKKVAIKKEVDIVSKGIQDIPGEPNKSDWTNHEKALKGHYQDLLQTYLRADESLERWFDGIENESTFDTFWTRLDDEKGKLEKEITGKGIKIGSPKDQDGQLIETMLPGFNWPTRDEVQKQAPTNEDQNEAKATLQKRFNITRAVANAISADRGKPNRLIDVTFLQRSLVRRGGSRPFAPPPPGTITVEPARYLGFVAGSYNESTLPTNGEAIAPAAEAAPGTPETQAAETPLGRTISFGFCVDMNYDEVPDLVRNLVYPTQDPVLSLTVVGVNIFVAEPNEIQRTEKKNVTSDLELQAKIKEAEQKTADGKPAPVRVYVTCQVFDFDPASVPTFLKK